MKIKELWELRSEVLEIEIWDYAEKKGYDDRHIIPAWLMDSEVDYINADYNIIVAHINYYKNYK